MKYKPLFVTGIGTNVGKTIVSAVLCEQLKADYWKPIQAGDLHRTDSDTVEQLISNDRTIIHPEVYRLELSVSPHEAAQYQGIKVAPSDFKMPETDNILVVEGAGGLFVPLSNSYLVVDLLRHMNSEVVLVVRNYMGCINHTLLSIHSLQVLKIPFKHVVMNGNFPRATRRVILEHIPPGVGISELPDMGSPTKSIIATQKKQLYYP